MLHKILLIVLPAVLSYGCVASQGDLGSIYARQARLEAKTNKLSQEVDELREQSSGTSSFEYENKLSQLETRVANLESAFSQMKKYEQNSDRVTSLEPGYGTSGTSEGETEINTAIKPQNVDEEAAVFNKGYNYLSENKYNECRDQFSLFIQKFPNSAEVSDAAFWKAECYYRDGQFEESILEFQKFIDNYPNDIKVPLAYYKQGLALLNINRKEEAKIFFQTLIDKYPRSEEARSAKEKLKELE